MLESGLINRDLCAALSRLGHRDELCLTDAGLAIADGVRCVDLSVRRNLPRFMDVLGCILENFSVEQAVIAEETRAVSPSMFEAMRQALGSGVEVLLVPHSQFLARSRQAKAAVRTGEFTAYCNLILVSGADLGKWLIEKT